MNSVLKGAIIGYGRAAEKNHIPAYLRRIEEKKDIKLVAIADICDARRQVIQQHLPSVRIYTDFEILLDEEALDLDFVDIATPPSYHLRIAKTAIERNLHVLSELPVSTNSAELIELINMAKEKKRVLFPCIIHKYSPIIKEVLSLIENGTIGTVTGITICHFTTSARTGAIEWKPEWRKDPSYGGGVFVDNYHLFYFPSIIMRSYPIAVSAKIPNEEMASVFLSFPNGFSQIFLYTYAGINKSLFTIHGANGSIFIDNDKIEVLSLKNERIVQERQFKIPSSSLEESRLFHSLLDEFISAIYSCDYFSDATAFYSLIIAEKAHQSNAFNCKEVTLEKPM